MARKKKLSLFDIVNGIFKAHDYESKYELDYICESLDRQEPKSFDDFYAVTTFGSVEGIYTDFYVIRQSDRKKERIGSAKTLYESDEAFIKMHELGALVSLELRKLSIKNSFQI